jgi:hypothetical protein
VVDDWTGTHDANKVYDSVDGLAASWHASMAALTAMPKFHAWQLSKPALKPLLLGSLWTAHGPRRVTASALSELAWPRRSAFDRRVSPRSESVSTAAAAAALGLVAQVLNHLSLGDTFHESL